MSNTTIVEKNGQVALATTVAPKQGKFKKVLAGFGAVGAMALSPMAMATPLVDTAPMVTMITEQKEPIIAVGVAMLTLVLVVALIFMVRRVMK